MGSEISIAIEQEADIVKARQKGRELCAELGFSNTDRTLVATAISEVARNIVRYAGRGEVLLRREASAGRLGIVVIARDEGPGIADPVAAMRDGFSTGDSLGLGLPGAKRLMDEFDLSSAPAAGTTITMRKWVR